jgi:hypothetical protein
MSDAKEAKGNPVTISAPTAGKILEKKSEAEKKESKEHKKKHRTTGLRLFDVFLYPFLTNFCVFVISVVATYLTSHGNEVGKAGSFTRKVGHAFQVRGEWLVGKFQKLGMSKGAADMAKMVFFSFADGSLIAPLVKLLEDRREKISRWIDTKLGTKPKDESVYAAEPKQSWWSVLSGRFATVSIVVPTAVLLEKMGWNDKLFSNPGFKAGEQIAKRPNFAKWFGKLHIPGLFKTVYFEAFYTSVCTAGLYFSSRLIATFTSRKKHEHRESHPHGEPHRTLEKPEPQATPELLEGASKEKSAVLKHAQDRDTPSGSRQR